MESIDTVASARGRLPGFGRHLTWRLPWLSDRYLLVMVAALNAATGLVMVAMLAPWYGGDAMDRQRMAQDLLAGGPLQGALYPPLAAIAFLPLAPLAPWGAAMAMTTVALVALAAGWWLETRGIDKVDRALLLIAALGFGPVVHELLIGQTTLLIAMALYPAVRREDTTLHGVAFGVVLATAPKPFLLPLLVWMLVYRRRAFAGALVTAAVLTLAGVVLLGVDRYRDWFGLLLGIGGSSVAGTYDAALSGNFSLWPLDPMRAVVVLAVLAGTAWAILRDQNGGLVAALLAGLIIAPYTEMYSMAILLLAIRPLMAVAPRACRLLAVSANIVLVLVLGFIPWALAGIGAVLLAVRPGAHAEPSFR